MDRIEDRKLTFEIEIAENANTFPANEQQLYRCLLNLIENAIDVTPAEAKVILRSRRSPDGEDTARLKINCTEAIVIHVIDTGAGINEEVRAKLFTPFFSTKGAQGTGLGLSVSRKIIDEHGGELALLSPPGQGADFAIFLPAERS